MGLLNRMSRATKGLAKYYYPFTWRNKPSVESPINEVHLNHIEDGINEMDNRILILSQDKANAADVANVLVDFDMNDTTGVMTFTRLDGSKLVHDSVVEKIALNCYLEDDNFVLELADGTKQKVSLSKFIDTYAFTSTDIIRMTVNGKNISADIPDGKITMEKLEPTVMSTIRQYLLDAQTAKGVAEQAASTAQGWSVGGVGFEGINAKSYAEKAQRFAIGGVEEGDIEDNAQYYCQQAQAAADEAAGAVGFDGKAASISATDIEGLVAEAGGNSNVQTLLDALAQKVAGELVSNSDLLSQLGNYLARSAVVQTESSSMETVPSSAYLKSVSDTLNSNLVTLEIPPQPLLTSEAAINDYYNTVSDSFANTTYYRRVVSHGVSHSVLSGGVFYLEGFRVNSSYEWQIARTYNNRIFYRDKITGVWRAWQKLIITSDLAYGTITSGSLAANATTTFHANFRSSLSRAPFVLAYMQNSATDSNNYYWVTNVTNITASGFDVTVKNTLNQTTGLNSTRCVKWIAMAQ